MKTLSTRVTHYLATHIIMFVVPNETFPRDISINSRANASELLEILKKHLLGITCILRHVTVSDIHHVLVYYPSLKG